MALTPVCRAAAHGKEWCLMAKCVNYKTGEICPHFYKCEHAGERIQVGTSMKALAQYSFYCKATPGVKKIASQEQFTGSTPKWCPLGRDPK